MVVRESFYKVRGSLFKVGVGVLGCRHLRYEYVQHYIAACIVYTIQGCLQIMYKRKPVDLS